MLDDELHNRFTYHAPFGDQPQRYSEIRDHGRQLAELIDYNCPESREKSLALTKVDEAVMWANAAIARRELPGPTSPPAAGSGSTASAGMPADAPTLDPAASESAPTPSAEGSDTGSYQSPDPTGAADAASGSPGGAGSASEPRFQPPVLDLPPRLPRDAG